MKIVELKVNGKRHRLAVEENWTLLYVLREVMELTGTKCGCGTGDCGSCKIIMDGQAVNACTIRIANAEGHEIETIEGLSPDGFHLHPIQQAFIDCGAVQCGFCTPGMVMTAKALLYRNPDPDEDEIKEALKGNLCRCTGYVKIVEAIKQAARVMKGMEG